MIDDIALPFGAIRMRAKGGDAGHNGLKNINEILGCNDYSRIRFGIGNDFHQGQQVDYVLSDFDEDQLKVLPERMDIIGQMIKSFVTIGVARTMNQFNKR